ncbi:MULTISPECIES: 6-hydroxymethylpterin diphosphokinase MptE-like protein [unclassified Endozoicomonas]|uniref:6-hydroxymethylpterin diphosphokinase MptE-like protein n=1 Tax=unclassified Endozoicomonas TaxID=2644528 RepID=UPI003BB7E152
MSNQFNLDYSENGKPFFISNNEKNKINLENPFYLRDSINNNVLILASGPSATDIDPKQLHSLTFFAVNGSAQLLLKHDIKPDYYVIDDLDVAQKRTELVLEGITKSKVSFVSPEILSFLYSNYPNCTKSNKFVVIFKRSKKPGTKESPLINYIKGLFDDNIYQSKTAIFSAKKRTLGFSTDITKGYFSARTIPFVAAQIAHYMGGKKIFFSGLDLQGTERFYEKSEKALPSTLDDSFSRYIEPSFKFLNTVTKKTSVRFYNFSENSKLSNKILEKINFSKFI